MGGGWSFLSRSYGLAIDTLLGAKVVLANGTAVELSAEAGDQDLWWALRGGGGGNFGVVTEFQLRLFSPEPASSVGQLCWGQLSPAVAPLFSHWIDGFAAMPRFMDLIPSWLPTGPGTLLLQCSAPTYAY